jgi:hypothetical protein
MFIKDIYIRTAFIISLVLIGIGFFLSYNAFKTTEHLLVIHFDAYRGIDFLGDKSDVFGILIGGGLINIVNILLALLLYRREHFFARILSFSSVFLSVLILITVTVIINTN